MISVTLKAHIVQTLKGLRGYEATERKVAVWFRRKREIQQAQLGVQQKNLRVHRKFIEAGGRKVDAVLSGAAFAAFLLLGLVAASLETPPVALMPRWHLKCKRSVSLETKTLRLRVSQLQRTEPSQAAYAALSPLLKSLKNSLLYHF